MFEKEAFKDKSVQINGLQYLTLQALLKAASTDKDRFSITRVFYDAAADQFVATNGLILRFEKLEWIGDKPENSFFLSRRDLMLTAAQLMLQFGADQGAAVPADIILDLEYGEYEDYEEHPYPNYAAVIPKEEERRPVEWIGLSPVVVASLNKTFLAVPRALRFQFSNGSRPVTIYEAAQNDEGEPVQRLVAVLCPLKMEGDHLPPPLFELKEIERKAPKGSEEAKEGEPSAEELGQQNLVEQAANGPVEA